MFGDIGHSLFLFVFSLYICFKGNKINQIFKGILPFRYFLLLMGFFGLFCGFMYNDFLSVPFNFPSCYNLSNLNESNITNYIEVNKTNNCNYKFGLDPIWYGASNELTFINSLKMKLSVIFGVLQMLLGIILKGLNNLYESDYIEFFFVFIPQIILMSILFGYMDLLIIFKWNINFNNDLSKAPDIKVIMMDIFLNPMGEYNKDYLPIWGNREKIKVFHSLILIISVICILIMIIPNIIFKKIKSDKNYENDLNKKKKEEEINEQLLMEDKNEIIKKSFSDITVGVLINSIEYILGTVSNTASYLRLWALSLAHSQLSKVFFDKF